MTPLKAEYISADQLSSPFSACNSAADHTVRKTRLHRTWRKSPHPLRRGSICPGLTSHCAWVWHHNVDNGAPTMIRPCSICGRDLSDLQRARAINFTDAFRCPNCKEWLVVSPQWSKRLNRLQRGLLFVICIGLLPLLIQGRVILYFILIPVLLIVVVSGSTIVALRLYPPKVERCEARPFEFRSLIR